MLWRFELSCHGDVRGEAGQLLRQGFIEEGRRWIGSIRVKKLIIKVIVIIIKAIIIIIIIIIKTIMKQCTPHLFIT